MKRVINELKVRLDARSENESVARSIVSAFAAGLNPTVEELAETDGVGEVQAKLIYDHFNSGE